MRRVGLVAAMIAVCLCYSGSALAASPTTYTVCSTGAAKPIIAPTSSGKCGAGHPTVVLATAAALTALQRQVNTLESQVAVLRTTLSGVVRSGHTLKFAGMDVQIVNGSGHTGSTNGLGNLIIGYDEFAGTQTGSHNLVLGEGQEFTSYGGILAGERNTIDSPFSSITGGVSNGVRALGSSVSGGRNNLASGAESSVSGGQNNIASGAESSVSGGTDNSAKAGNSSVTGGWNNIASGISSVVIGGEHNSARGPFSTERGGDSKTVSKSDAFAP